MKKMLMTVVAMLASVVSFAAQNDKLIMFSTPGPDMYADGSAVKDGECYALVWVKDGSEFAGFKANGALVDEVNNQLIYVAALAKDGCCPSVMFEIDADKAEALKGGSYVIFMLDTRDAAGNVQGVTAEGQAKAIRCYGEAAVVDSQAMICTAVSRKLVLASVATTIETVADLQAAINAGQTVNEGVIKVDSDTIGSITEINLGGKTHGATLEVTGNGILQVSNGSINIKAQAWAEIPILGKFWLGSLGLVEAVAQNAEQLGFSTDNAEVFLTNDYVGYPQAWTDYKVGADIPENFRDKVDIAYSFYAMNPKVDQELGVSDWALYYENAATTPAQEARLAEIQSQLAPFVQNKSDQDRWHADFVVYFDKPVAEGSVELSGCYGTWLDGTVLTYALDKDMEDGDKYRLLRDKASIFYSYNEILTNVKEFGCGVKNLSNANVGTTMTVELRIFRGVSGHVEDTEDTEDSEPLSILIGSYEYILRGSEIATSIAEDADIPAGKEEVVAGVALGNKAVDSFKQTGLESGSIGMKLTQAGLSAKDVVEAMTFEATAIQANVDGAIVLRMPVDKRTKGEEAEVYCDGDSIGRYPIQALVISSQAPLADPTRKPEGMEGKSWEECSPVDSVIYTFVEFPAQKFPANYSYVICGSTITYSISYDTAKEGVTVPEGAPKSYGVADEVALPTVSAEGFAFLGWKAADNGKYLSKVAKGTIGDLKLKAYWKDLSNTDAEKMEVAKGKNEAGVPAEFKVEVSSEVIAAAAEGNKSVAEVLNAKEDNGLAKWQNMAVEQAKLNGEFATSVEKNAGAATESVVDVKIVVNGVTGVKGIGLAQITTDSGVKTVVKDVVEKKIVAEDDTKVITVDYTKLDTGIYQPTMFVENVDKVQVEIPDPTAASITVLKPTSDQESVIVPVPGDKTAAGGEVSIANVIDNGSLAEGDQIRFYNENGHYDIWTRNNDGTWVEGTTVSAAQGQTQQTQAKPATEVKLPAGGAFWLTRGEKADKSKPVTVIAQSKDEVKTSIGKDWNLIANPKTEAIDLDAVCRNVSAAGDKIVVPTKGLAQKTYTFKDGKWGYTEYYSENGRVKARRVLASDEKIAPGQGLWYVSGADKGDNKVEWNNK